MCLIFDGGRHSLSLLRSPKGRRVAISVSLVSHSAILVVTASHSHASSSLEVIPLCRNGRLGSKYWVPDPIIWSLGSAP